MLQGFLDANRITDYLKLNSVAAEESSCTGDSITATTTAPAGNAQINYLDSYFFYEMIVAWFT